MVLLLLKAAGPALASVAAVHRGVALVEICTTYGVRTVAVDVAGAPAQAPHDPAPAGEPRGAGSGEACVLASLPLLGLPPLETPRILHRPAGEISRVPALAASPLPDPSRTWWAGLKQGPPQS